MLPGRLLIVTDGAFDVAVAKVPFWIGVVWSTLLNATAPITTSWFPVQFATISEAVLDGLTTGRSDQIRKSCAYVLDHAEQDQQVQQALMAR